MVLSWCSFLSLTNFFSLQKSNIFCQKIKCAMFYELFFCWTLSCPIFHCKKGMYFFSCKKVFFNAIYNGKKVGRAKKFMKQSARPKFCKKIKNGFFSNYPLTLFLKLCKISICNFLSWKNMILLYWAFYLSLTALLFHVVMHNLINVAFPLFHTGCRLVCALALNFVLVPWILKQMKKKQKNS